MPAFEQHGSDFVQSSYSLLSWTSWAAGSVNLGHLGKGRHLGILDLGQGPQSCMSISEDQGDARKINYLTSALASIREPDADSDDQQVVYLPSPWQPQSSSQSSQQLACNVTAAAQPQCGNQMVGRKRGRRHSPRQRVGRINERSVEERRMHSQREGKGTVSTTRSLS